MRIKHAYNTLLNSDSRRKYEYGNRSSGYSYTDSQRSRSQTSQQEEEFYGFGKIYKPPKLICSVLASINPLGSVYLIAYTLIRLYCQS